ncbi:hypothetical protein cand_037040 [Cryptosporidium andersoni]|uniref:Pyridoxal phosphate homeostasis protein n=1 Tax=Cryptosporidium andersoni TaxID=117008 RepID=A0A1J4MV46_9CRYT|nr:hypothetical protein cand_037040 [Cryptosporidium andersoni]
MTGLAKDEYSKKELIQKSLLNTIAAVDRACKIFQSPVPRILIVSKQQPIEAILDIYMLNYRHFGENYVKELVLKSSRLPEDIMWHFIGHLQRNKVRLLLTVKNLYIIESLDSIELAYLIQKICEEMKRCVNVYIQIKTSTETTKTGINIEESEKLVKYVLDNCPRLNFLGFMTIADNDKSKCSECFSKLVDLRARTLDWMTEQAHSTAKCELSMGMSDDFEIAIIHKTNEIRIGSAIFGLRSK